MCGCIEKAHGCYSLAEHKGGVLSLDVNEYHLALWGECVPKLWW